MNTIFSHQQAVIPTWAVRRKTKSMDKKFLILSIVFAGFILIFMMTLFASGLSPFLVQRVRWLALAGATGVFVLLRKYPVASVPLSLILFYFAAFLSSVLAEGYLFSLAKLAPMTLSLLLMFYLVPSAFTTKHYKQLITVIGALICVLSSASIAIGVLTGRILSVGRYESLYFGPNTEGAYMGFTFFAALWLWAEYPKFKFRIWFQLLIPASLVACYATGSRSSFFGMLIGVMVWGLTLLVRGQSKRRRQLIIAFMLLSGALIAKRSFFAQGWAMMTRQAQTSEEFFASRMWIWEDSWKAFKQRPYLGHGYGVSGLVTDEKEVSLGTSVSVRDGSGYLGLLESVGIVGCSMFGLLVLQLVMMEIHLLRNRIMNEHVVTAHGMSAMTAFLLVNHVGEPWLLGPGNPTFHLFWFFMGAAFYFNFLARSEEKMRRRMRFQQRMAMMEAQRHARMQAALRSTVGTT